VYTDSGNGTGDITGQSDPASSDPTQDTAEYNLALAQNVLRCTDNVLETIDNLLGCQEQSEMFDRTYRDIHVLASDLRRMAEYIRDCAQSNRIRTRARSKLKGKDNISEKNIPITAKAWQRVLPVISVDLASGSDASFMQSVTEQVKQCYERQRLLVQDDITASITEHPLMMPLSKLSQYYTEQQIKSIMGIVIPDNDVNRLYNSSQTISLLDLLTHDLQKSCSGDIFDKTKTKLRTLSTMVEILREAHAQRSEEPETLEVPKVLEVLDVDTVIKEEAAGRDRKRGPGKTRNKKRRRMKGGEKLWNLTDREYAEIF